VEDAHGDTRLLPAERCSRRRSAGEADETHGNGEASEAVISSGSTKTAASSEHRSERSEPSDTASLGERSNEARLTGAIRAERALASGAIKNVLVLWVALVRLDASVDRSRYG